MRLVIDIPEEEYMLIKQKMELNVGGVTSEAEQAIVNGTLLQKGHGRLLDEKEILASEDHDGGYYDLVDMPGYIAGVPAVIEADKAESEEQS